MGDTPHKTYCREYYATNRDAELARKKKYRQENAERISTQRKAGYRKRKPLLQAQRAEWYQKNKEAAKERSRKYRQDSAEKVAAAAKRRKAETRPQANAREAKRNAAKKLALPAWADEGQIQTFYTLAKLLEELTGLPWHVDHIVPLQNDLVCGLHVPANSQVILAAENLRKGSSFDPQLYTHIF